MPDGSTHQYVNVYQAPGAGWARKIIDDLHADILQQDTTRHTHIVDCPDDKDKRPSMGG